VVVLFPLLLPIMRCLQVDYLLVAIKLTGIAQKYGVLSVQ